MSERNSSRKNFGQRGGQGFKNNNNCGRQNTSTKKHIKDLHFRSVAKNKPVITKILHCL